MARIKLTENELKRIISESVKNCIKEASQEDIDFYDNTENRIAARESIANYVNQMMVEYSLSIKDVRHIMKTLNRYIQSNDSF
jgi:L-rhamnose isomerase